MAGSTPIYGFPYPESSDLVANYPALGQDLAEDIEAVLAVGFGKVLQVVRATDTTNRSTTSGTYADVTGMSVTISPQKSDSAVIILASFDIFVSDFTGSQVQCDLQITDSSNNAISGAQRTRIENSGPTGATYWAGHQNLVAYATPATTSAVTYKLRFRVLTANDLLDIRNAESTGQMFAIEVSA